MESHGTAIAGLELIAPCSVHPLGDLVSASSRRYFSICLATCYSLQFAFIGLRRSISPLSEFGDTHVQDMLNMYVAALRRI